MVKAGQNAMWDQRILLLYEHFQDDNDGGIVGYTVNDRNE